MKKGQYLQPSSTDLNEYLTTDISYHAEYFYIRQHSAKPNSLGTIGYKPLMSLAIGFNTNFTQFNELWNFYLKFNIKNSIHHLKAACVH